MMKIKVSKRGQNVTASPIRKFLPFVQAAEKEGVRVFKINVGDPDLEPPPDFLKTIKAYDQKVLSYAPSPGITQHTQAWQKYYRQFGVSLPMANIVPTVGAAEAISLAMMAVADPGDEILVFEPLYTCYKSFATMVGVKLVPVLLPIKNNFALPGPEVIEKKITKKTRAIVVINPDNPTGKLWSQKELDMVVAIAKKHNLFIISDETYREIRFDGRKPVCMLNYKQAKDLVILTDSCSKRFSMPGARIGCIASFNDEVMHTILKFAQSRLSAGTLEQLGLVPLLNNSAPYVNKVAKEYQRRRDVVAKGLSQMPGAEFKPSQGSIYQAAKLPIKSGEDFVRFLIAEFRHNKQTVMITPMEDFYITPGFGKQEIRIAYVLNTKDLTTAMDLLKRGLAAYRMKTK